MLTKRKICSGAWSTLFFAIAIEPAAFKYFKITDTLFDFATLGMFLIVFLFHFVTLLREPRKTLTHARIPYLIMAYYAYLLLVTTVNGGRVRFVLNRILQFTNIVMYVDMVLKNNPQELFRKGLNILTFYVTLNCLTCFAFPDGLYSNEHFNNCYLLGYDNQNINFILPALILVLIKHLYYKKCKLQILFTYAVAAITVFKVWSGMSIVVILCCGAFAFFFFKRSGGFVAERVLNGRIFNMFNLLIVNIAAFFGLVFFHIQEYFELFITVFLHKKMTLTGRVLAWERNLRLIGRNPIFGYGCELPTIRATKLGYNAASVFGEHAHNRFLETMYRGGILLTGLYLYMLFYVSRCLKPYRNSFFAKIISFGIFIYLIGMLTEQYDYSPFFWVFMVIAENAESCVSMNRKS